MEPSRAESSRAGGAEMAAAAAELQGKYQKLAQEYSKVPGTGARSPGAARGCSGAFRGPGVPPPGDEAEAASGGHGRCGFAGAEGARQEGEWSRLQDILEYRPWAQLCQGSETGTIFPCSSLPSRARDLVLSAWV